jgi:hypothetical protein
MNTEQKIEFTKHFMKQYKLLKSISLNSNCDLYGDEEKIKILEEKQLKLKKIKEQFVKMYSVIISEF